MLNGVTFMKDAMSGKTVGSAAKILTIYMRGDEWCQKSCKLCS